MTAPYSKGGSPVLDPPNGPSSEDLQAYMSDRVLRLPVGTWHVYAIAEFATADCAPGVADSDRYELRAEITIEVIPPAAARSAKPQVVPTDEPVKTPDAQAVGPNRWKSTETQGDFELAVEAAKATFSIDETLDVVASLTYRGPEDRITINHGFWGPVEFSMRAPGVTLLPSAPYRCVELELERDVPFETGLRDLSGVQEPFKVVHGLHPIEALAGFQVGSCEGAGLSLQTTIIVAVVDGPDDIPLFTQDDAPRACLMLRNGGRLVEAERGLGVTHADESVREVIWPFGYSARRTADRATLLGRDGRVIAVEGDQVVFDAFTPTVGPLSPCGDVEMSAEIELATYVPPTYDGIEICMTASVGGVLARHPTTGLGFANGSEVIGVEWPEGYTARIDDGLAVLIRPSGEVAATEGDFVTSSGGHVGDNLLRSCGI